MKVAFIASLLLPLFLSAQTKTTLKGVITYFFNEYQGDKPDVGAHIWVIDSADAKDFNIKTADSFYYANFYLEIKASYVGMGVAVPADVLKRISDYGADAGDNFNSLDRRNAMQVFSLEYNSKVRKATVDGSGSYSFSLPPGDYFVYIKSNGRQGQTVSEISGKMRIMEVRLAPTEDADASWKFDLH